MLRRHACQIGLIALALLAGCATTPLPVVQSPMPAADTAPRPPAAVAPKPVPIPQSVETPRTAPANDLWARIRNGFRLAPLDSLLVAEHEQWYATRPDYVQRMTERSQRYLYFIVEEVEKRGMPSEIALLPMIESAFNPTALSRSSASGIWQFIPSTGKHYGLDQNWWYDGRRNVIAATGAALDYLQKLYDQFGSWELALAAYNCGEGCVARAIAANRARDLDVDYLSLKLPGETRNYVPKLMAMKNIVLDPFAHGLAWKPIPNSPYFETVDIRRHIDVALAARFADMTLEEFTALNPAYNKPVISPQDNGAILLPADNAAVFRANLQRYSDRPLHSWQAYPARRGERIDKIADKFGLTVAQLQTLNRVQVNKKRNLVSEQLLLVPVSRAKPLPQPAVTQVALQRKPDSPANPAATNDTTTANSESRTYTVQPGDTLFNIAQRAQTSVATLQRLNALEDDSIKIGSVLTLSDAAPASSLPPARLIPAVAVAEPAVESRPIAPASTDPIPPSAWQPDRAAPSRTKFYVVRRGDTLAGIARLFRVAVNDLARWNRLHPSSPLLAGMRVKVVAAR